MLVLLFNVIVWFSRRPEKIDERMAIKGADFRRAIFPRVGNVADMVPEKFQIQPEGSVGTNPHDLAKRIEKGRLAVGREAHHFVFVAIIRKPEELGQRGIKNT